MFDLIQADAARSLKNVLSPENKAWNHRVVPFSLPPYLRLILADVNAGSDTPALVAKVLKWRSSSPEQGKKS
jgi:phosphomevalonate kinase